MKNKLAATLLATTLAVQLGAAAFADGDTATDLLVHTLTLPFRLTTGALTGTFGLVTGGFQGAYDLSVEANDKVIDGGATPAQLLIWPFTIPVGFVKGGVSGFAEKFPEGYDYWDTWTEK